MTTMGAPPLPPPPPPPSPTTTTGIRRRRLLLQGFRDFGLSGLGLGRLALPTLPKDGARKKQLSFVCVCVF